MYVSFMRRQNCGDVTFKCRTISILHSSACAFIRFSNLTRIQTNFASAVICNAYLDWLIQPSFLALATFLTMSAGVRMGHARLVGWFWFNGPLRRYFSLYRAVSQRERERRRREKTEESKKVQITPTRTYCKRNRPLPYHRIM